MIESFPVKIRGLGALGNVMLLSFSPASPMITNHSFDLARTHSDPITQTKEFGVMTDMAEQLDPSESAQAVDLIQKAGFGALKETVVIDTGDQGFRNLNPDDQTRITNSLEAATQAHLPITLALEQHAWPLGKGKRFRPPLTATQQSGFCKVGAELVKQYPIIDKVSVGVEPNNAFLWEPQFRNGHDAVSKPYVSLLAKCYQIIRGSRTDSPPQIIGGELASSGNDSPRAKDGDHSPVVEIKNLCKTYADSKITTPLFDEFSVHGYTTVGETLLTTHTHSTRRGIGDYESLDKELNCFVQTGKQQRKPKIIFGEVGLPTKIAPSQRYRYNFNTAPLKNSIGEKMAGEQIAQAMQEVDCEQPDSVGIYNFQFVDDRSNLDTGFFMPPPNERDVSSAFAGLKAKGSLSPVVAELTEINDGTACP